jgi:hypothetical protein
MGILLSVTLSVGLSMMAIIMCYVGMNLIRRPHAIVATIGFLACLAAAFIIAVVVTTNGFNFLRS